MLCLCCHLYWSGYIELSHCIIEFKSWNLFAKLSRKLTGWELRMILFYYYQLKWNYKFKPGICITNAIVQMKIWINLQIYTFPPSPVIHKLNPPLLIFHPERHGGIQCFCVCPFINRWSDPQANTWTWHSLS